MMAGLEVKAADGPGGLGEQSTAPFVVASKALSGGVSAFTSTSPTAMATATPAAFAAAWPTDATGGAAAWPASSNDDAPWPFKGGAAEPRFIVKARRRANPKPAPVISKPAPGVSKPSQAVPAGSAAEGGGDSDSSDDYVSPRHLRASLPPPPPRAEDLAWAAAHAGPIPQFTVPKPFPAAGPLAHAVEIASAAERVREAERPERALAAAAPLPLPDKGKGKAVSQTPAAAAAPSSASASAALLAAAIVAPAAAPQRRSGGRKQGVKQAGKGSGGAKAGGDGAKSGGGARGGQRKGKGRRTNAKKDGGGSAKPKGQRGRGRGRGRGGGKGRVVKSRTNFMALPVALDKTHLLAMLAWKDVLALGSVNKALRARVKQYLPLRLAWKSVGTIVKFRDWAALRHRLRYINRSEPYTEPNPHPPLRRKPLDGQNTPRQTHFQCGHCFCPGAKKKCSGCKLVVYCSNECQSDNWSAHKDTCKLVKKHLSKLRKDAKPLRARGFFDPKSRFKDDDAAQDYLGQRYELIAEILEAVPGDIGSDVVVEHLLDIIWLTDGQRRRPVLAAACVLLRLDRLQEAYDLIKWWEVSRGSAKPGSQLLAFRDTNVTEPPHFVVSTTPPWTMMALAVLKFLVWRKVSLVEECRGDDPLEGRALCFQHRCHPDWLGHGSVLFKDQTHMLFARIDATRPECLENAYHILGSGDGLTCFGSNFIPHEDADTIPCDALLTLHSSFRKFLHSYCWPNGIPAQPMAVTDEAEEAAAS